MHRVISQRNNGRDRAPTAAPKKQKSSKGVDSLSSSKQWIFANLHENSVEVPRGHAVNPDHHWFLYPRWPGKTSSIILLLALCFVGPAYLILKNFLIEGVELLDLPADVPHPNYENCFEKPANRTRDNLISSHPKLVFMVIDAWKLDFLTDPKSAMKFTRGKIASGRAVVFNTTVHSPTVTLPRIRAMCSGMIPSFASTITNLMADAATEDSWVEKARSRKKRIMFYGDDTWLKLYPDTFSDYHGVTSFYVNDYTEVDNNVTVHMRPQLSNHRNWDIMILHYLGLDHIGHSLGGESSEIPKKLREMDKRIEEIYNKMASTGPLLLVVVGDHGMTKMGSHGGSSPDETHVPVVVFHSKAIVTKGHDWDRNETIMKLMQVDVATTMSLFLSLPIPNKSRGLSFIPLLSRNWFVESRTMFYDSVNLGMHLQRFVRPVPSIAQLENLDPRLGPDSYCPTVKKIAYEATRRTYVVYRDIQGVAIEHYRTVFGPAAWVGLTLLALMAMYPFGSDLSFCLNYGLKLWTLYDYAQLIICAIPLYSYLSSSLVEEEHDTWNYMTSTVIVVRLLITVRHAFLAPRLNDSKLDDGEQQRIRSDRARKLCIETLLLLIVHRAAMGITSGVRRRWSMDPDLLPPAVFPDCYYLRVVGQFLSDHLDVKLIATQFPGAINLLCTAYLAYRVHYYAERRREQWYHLMFMTVPCLALLVLRSAFSALGFSMTEIAASAPVNCVYFAIFITFIISPSFAVIFYLSFLVRPQFFPLIVLIIEMGIRARRVFIDRFFLAIMIQATLFYMGTSFNISTIDVAVGYTGLSSYVPAAVAFQIGMNFYAGPIVFILAYNLFYTPSEDAVSELVEEVRPSKEKWNERPFFAFHFYQYRLLICSHSVIAMRLFFDHLFSWTVFSPKALFEIVNTAVLSAMMIIIVLWINISRQFSN